MYQSNKVGILSLAISTFLLTSLPFIYLLSEINSSSSKTSITQKFYPSKPAPLMYKDELEVALEGASMANKTVIIVIANKAYTEGNKPMLDIFLDGFWLGEDTRRLKKHLLIVAIDQMAFERCMFLRLFCYRLKTDDGNFVDEKIYMSKDFVKMMWLRTRFLRDVLRLGYSFVFTDMDVLWLRNPFPILTVNQVVDLQISVDWFNGNQWSEKHMINTGFYMIKSNNKTIALFDEWYTKRKSSSGKKEQDVLLKMMRKGAFTRLGLKVKFLDTNYFSGFCQDSRDVSVVTTVHANCCRSIKAKLVDLSTVIHDWKRFNDALENRTRDFRWSEHLSCQSSWLS
ncbi:uncharacterized protein At1g28695-like [Rutidosis leptorrhynchoides]|uniref:uncharacterized protein At1g28695-like n=1 Tax=Rutidosis leptorrhynchoides TaxID=125765 RepID=UPI003A994A67